MSPRLALRFLGIPELVLDGRHTSTDRRKAVASLAYLAVNRGTYTREFLSGLLWPDYDQKNAFSNLRRTVWEIHQVIGQNWLIAKRESLSLNPEAQVELDVAQFQNLLAQAHQQSDPTLRIPFLSDAAKLYRNHFLTGFSLNDAFPFNEWVYAESEELRRQLAQALTTLSEDYCGLGQAEKAIPYARRLISLDPLNESAHRQLMEVYIQAGQHSAALKQYQTCEQLLHKELNLDPQPETHALYKKIRKRELKPIPLEKPIETTTPKHNLPVQLSTFIGRETEQDEIVNLLATHRLVTLAGVGGIGKTRLSLQVGQSVLKNFPDGVWFITLDSLSDPTLVPQTVAAAFGIRQGSAHSVTETTLNVLGKSSSLIILDNCEHLLDACTQLIMILLQNCPNLKILATSRELLNVIGEATYYVPSLSLPEQDDTSIENLDEYASAQLFIERATLASSSFSLSKENAKTIIDICRRVDGIPLAIELAAARVNILQVEEILKQLQKSFALLARDGRTIIPRQQTIQASMDWSWGLLSESEQIFLRRLSVFAGGWTLESAQSVCDGNVLSLTSALVKKSLIVVKQETGRETRYHFHEIVRQYAREKLTESAEEEHIRTQHLQYFLKLSEYVEPGLHGFQHEEWFARMIDERYNLRAALEQATKNDIEAGLYISGRLQDVWEILDTHEGSRWLAEFLQKPEAKKYPYARARALQAQACLQIVLQQFQQAQASASQSLALFAACNEQQGEIDALHVLGTALGYLGDRDGEAKLYEKALTLSQSLNDKWREARTLYFMGWSPQYHQNNNYWKEASRLFRELGANISLANTLSLLAWYRVLYGEIKLAQKDLEEAESLWRSNKSMDIWEDTKLTKCLFALIDGDYEQARSILEEMVLTAKEKGNRMNYLWLRVRLGYVALCEGKIGEAHEIFAETTQKFQEDQNVIGVVFALEGVAGIYVAIGKPGHAARLIGWADAMREKIHDTRPPLEQADVDKIIAACVAKMGEAMFSDAYEEGQKMSLDEAVNYALES